MFIFNSHRRFRFSFLALLFLLLAIGSVTLGAITYAASETGTLQSFIFTNEQTGNTSLKERTLNFFSNNVNEFSVVYADPDLTFTVNNNGDTNDANQGDGICADASGNCTLRAAIQESNATPGTDSINFSLTTPATIQLNSALTPAELVISQAVNINGSGARLLTVRGNVNTANGIFNITNAVGAGTVNISGITIADSSARGLTNDAALNLTDVIIKGNTFGIYNIKDITLNRVLIHNNSNSGVYIGASATAAISNTTITNNNSPNFGGGIQSLSGNVTLNNVTISHNTATTSGGGFYYNRAASGVNVRNTIIALNTAPTGPDILSVESANNHVFVSRGNNLIGKSQSNLGFVNSTNGDKVGTLSPGLDPLLGPLQNNGGLTDTRALLDGSPARDAGNNCVTNMSCASSNPPTNLDTDQRGTGFTRNYDSTVDMGAFESFYPVAALASFVPTNRGTGTAAFELTINGTNFVADSKVKWNGADRATTFVSNTQIKAQILAGDVASAGQTPVTVTNPTPGGGASPALNFTVANCTFSIDPTSQNFAAAGGTGSVNVTTPSGCAWTATSNDGWITINSGTPGNGSGTLNFTVAANNGLARTGTLTIAGQTFTVNQGNGCIYTLNPTSANHPAGAANYSFALTTSNPNCTWTITDDAAWITVTNTSGNNSATINYSLTANVGAQRSGTITVTGALPTQTVNFPVTQTNGCTYTLNPTSANHPATTGAYSFALTTSDPTCAWTATDDASWITVTNASGTGGATINYTLEANNGPQRTGKITVNGQDFNITQASGCTFTFNPTSANFPAAGAANNTFAVNANNQTCTWTATTNDNWITINSGTSGTGSGTINFTVAANTGPQRTGKITVGSSEFNITQTSGCTYSINPTSATPTAAGGTGSFSITTPNQSCAWTAAVESGATSWLSVTGSASGTGNGTINYSVTANNGLARTGKISVGGQDFTVAQANGCVYALTPTNRDYPNTATTASTFTVTTSNQNCTWTATRNDNWLTITNGASGTGNGTVTFDVAANTGVARSGTITVSGAVSGQNVNFTANQAIGCAYTLTPNNTNISASGGTGSFDVATAGGCGWTATSNAAWITVNSGSPGNGNGTVGFTVAANAGVARTGTITVTANGTGQTFNFTVNQANGCVYTLTPGSASPTNAGGNGSFNVTTSDQACTWTTTVTAANSSWVSITGGASGTGNGTVNYTVGANNGLARAGTITLAGMVSGQTATFTINQANGCVYTLVPTQKNVPATAANNSFDVQTSNPNCTWTATRNDSWLTVTGGASGTGNGTVSFSHLANAGVARAGTITVSGAVSGQISTFTVNQASGCTYALNPTTVTQSAASGSYSVALTTSDPTCAWTASDDASWIAVTNASGTGGATINYTLEANTGLARAGTITVSATVNGQPVTATLTVTQSNGCVYTLTPADRSLTAAGGTSDFALTTSNQNCTWTATKNGSWLNITSPTTGAGNATIAFSAEANTGLARGGGITVTGAIPTQTVTGAINQANGCVYALTPTSGSYPNSATQTALSFAVGTSNPNCTWTATAPGSDWISIVNGSGTGNGNVTFNLAANAGPNRTGTITVAGAVSGQTQNFTVNQASGCIYTLNPNGTTFGSESGSGSFNIVVNTQSCQWTASTTDSWITIISTPSGTGNGTVSFSIQANVSPQRAGKITIKEPNTATAQDFTITQDNGCQYSISPANFNATAAGAANRTFNVNAGAGCQWTAASNQPWLTINSGASGVGSGTVNYTVAANIGLVRSGAITVTGAVTGQTRVHTVNQDNGCAITLTPASRNHPNGGSTGSTVTVATSAPGCTWTAAVNPASATWVSITGGASGTGGGTITYNIAANNGPQRSAKITVTGQVEAKDFDITQNDGCTYTLAPTATNVPQTGATRSFNVSTSASGCTWTAVSNAPTWIEVNSGASGTGNGVVNLTVSANSGPDRIGTVSVNGASGQTVNFTVNQISLVVTNTNDAGTGSLRKAIENANNIPGDDTITFQQNLVGGITLTTGEIKIEGNLEIRGPGADRLLISGNNASRIFYINNVTVTISGLTLSGGNGIGLNSTDTNRNGGAIYVFGGSLTLNAVSVSDNTITVPAGQGNRGVGGGIYYFGGENHQIINSTISSNSSTYGAGYYNQNGTISISNSTFTLNVAREQGGAIYSTGDLALRNATISENRAIAPGDSGAGVFIGSGVLNIGNTILAGNIGPELTFFTGGFNSVGNNLVGDSPGDSTNTGPGLIIYHPTDIKDTPPRLGILNVYGGKTLTMGVLPGSPVIDAGNNDLSVSQTDQRGSNRIINGTVDIGAFEYNIRISPTATQLPNGTIGQQYQTQLSTTRIDSTDPLEPFEYFVIDGFLPGGVTITQDGGFINGNPNTGGTYDFSVKSVGTDGMAGVNKYRIVVSCSYSISPTSRNAPATGESNTVSVNAAPGCAWTVTVNNANPWITSSTQSGTGSGTVNYTVAANSGPPRSGTMTIAGQTFTVNQENGCSFALNPNSANNVSAGGASGNFNINTINGCGWTATSNAAWLTISGNNSGTGSAALSYTIAANTGISRSGKITITRAGGGGTPAEFNVTQLGGCSYTLPTPANANLPIGGGSGSFTVTTTNGCNWTASINPPTATWLTITPVNNDTGPGRVDYTVTPNTGARRSAVINVMGQTYTINQDGTGNFDFDGDGKADPSVYRPTDGNWYLLRSTAGFTGAQFGIATDQIVPADFDGDGKADIAVFRDGTWFLLRSQLGFTATQFGAAGDLPRPADFDGDGKADICVFRPSLGAWFRLNSSNGEFVGLQFGANGDIPFPADFDGDRKADINVFRRSDGGWYRLNSSNGQFAATAFGIAEDIPAPADFDGDGKADITVFRPSVGVWFRLNSSNGSFAAAQFGTNGDKPVAADFDGDGRADIAVFRPSNGSWFWLKSSDGQFVGVQFGANGDQPIPAYCVP
jgi:predicted outer membrane repeat protein